MRLPRIATCLSPFVRLILGVAAPSATASAQLRSLDRYNMGFEIRPVFGSFLPAGNAKASLASSSLGGLQMSLAVNRHVALSVTVTVAPTTDLSAPATPGLDVVMYDLGGEWRFNGWKRGGTSFFTPFVGAGLGSLAYEYSDSTSTSVSNRDGYLAVGGEIGVGLIGIRLEGRDYLSHVSAVASPTAGKTRQNDITVALGLAFRLGRSASPEAAPRPSALANR